MVRILIIMCIFITACGDTKNNDVYVHSEADDLNEIIIYELQEFSNLVYKDELAETEDRVIALSNKCNSYPGNNIYFDVFVECKSILLSYLLGVMDFGKNQDYIYKEDLPILIDIFKEYKEILDVIRSEISEGIFVNDGFLTFIGGLISNSVNQRFMDEELILLSEIESLLDELIISIPKGEDSNFYRAKIFELKADIFFLRNDRINEKKFRILSIEEYTSYFEEINWIILDQKLKIHTIFFENNELQDAKNLLLEIISETSFDQSPEEHLKSWVGLVNIEAYHGNFQDEFLYRKIFFEKYFYAVRDLNWWSSEIDGIYLNEFALNLDYLGCESAAKSIDKYLEIKKIREDKLGSSFIMYQYFDVDLQILKNNYLCADNKANQDEIGDQIYSKLQKWLDEDIYEPYELYQFALHIHSLDFEDKKIVDLYKEFIDINHVILEEILDGINTGELPDNIFNQYLTDTIIFPLVTEIEYLDPERSKKNLEYINLILDNFFVNSDNTGMNAAYKNLKHDLTVSLISQGFKREALKIYSKFEEYESTNFEVVNAIKLLEDDDLLSKSEIIVSATNLEMSCKNKKCSSNFQRKWVNKFINGSNSFEKNQIELALFLEKNTKTSLISIIKNEFAKTDEISKYLNQNTDYEAKDPNSEKSIEALILKSLEELGQISESDLDKVNVFLYPEIEIETIRENLTENQVIVSYIAVPYRESYFLISLKIDRSSTDINIQSLSFDIDSDIIFMLEDLRTSVSNSNNLQEIDKIIKKSKDISRILLKDISISGKKDIFFISNFHEPFNPNLLWYKNNWLVSQFNIHYFLSWADLFNRTDKESKINERYIGFADVDYSNHLDSFVSLKETRQEINKSSENFRNSQKFFSDNVNSKNIFAADKDNAVIHFATHNTSIEKYGFSDIPALVVFKDKESSIVDDGFLDAFEIQKLNLQNSDIILSACSTLYSNNSDENFSKLIRSFKISGARSIMATRWDIESFSAVKFSSEYINLISTGSRPGEAVSEIQRSFISSQNYYHPFYWGPYIAVGY